MPRSHRTGKKILPVKPACERGRPMQAHSIPAQASHPGCHAARSVRPAPWRCRLQLPLAAFAASALHVQLADRGRPAHLPPRATSSSSSPGQPPHATPTHNSTTGPMQAPCTLQWRAPAAAWCCAPALPCRRSRQDLRAPLTCGPRPWAAAAAHPPRRSRGRRTPTCPHAPRAPGPPPRAAPRAPPPRPRRPPGAAGAQSVSACCPTRQYGVTQLGGIKPPPRCRAQLEGGFKAAHAHNRRQAASHHAEAIMHHASCIMHHASCIMHHASCIMVKPSCKCWSFHV